MSFVEHRRDPTGPRSWRRAPVFVGDVAAFVDEIVPLVYVSGVLARERVEVVGLEQLQTAPGTFNALSDVHEGIRDGRLVTYAVPRDELSPATKGIFEDVSEVDS